MLEHVIVTAGIGLEYGGVETDVGSVSRAVINLVIGMLQLLQLDHVLNDDVRKLSRDLEMHSAKAQELSTTMPQEVGSSLMRVEGCDRAHHCHPRGHLPPV